MNGTLFSVSIRAGGYNWSQAATLCMQSNSSLISKFDPFLPTEQFLRPLLRVLDTKELTFWTHMCLSKDHSGTGATCNIGIITENATTNYTRTLPRASTLHIAICVKCEGFGYSGDESTCEL